jgi:hypothetical protein
VWFLNDASEGVTRGNEELLCLCSSRRPATCRVAAEAWIIELPQDADVRKLTGQAAKQSARVWQTTLTAETAVEALLLPEAAQASLLEMLPQVLTLPLQRLSQTCFALIILMQQKHIDLVALQAEVDVWAALAARQACIDKQLARL